MNPGQVQARIGRREMHSSRAVASVLAATILGLVLAWVGTEIVLAAIRWPPLLARPLQMAEWAAGVAGATVPAVLLAAGLVLALAGLVLVLLGVLPGGRSRHRLSRGRAAVIVDDAVLAAALSRVAHRHARLVPDQVTTTVGPRRIDLSIRPTSGAPVDEAGVLAAVQAELERYDLDPAPRLALRISDQGVVGV